MGKRVSRFQKSEPEPLSEDLKMALREAAGWPLLTKQVSGSKHVHRTVINQYDGLGRLVGTIEQIDEDQQEHQSETWGK